MTGLGKIISFLFLFLVILYPQTSFSGLIYDKVFKSGVVRIGVPYNLTPQGNINNSGDWLGFEVDLADELSKHMNLKLEKVKVNPKTWGPMLTSGQIDAALCRIVHSRYLENEYDFSEPYFFDIPCILVNRGTAKSIQDFKGTKLAVVQGSTYEKLAMNMLKSLNDEHAQKNVYSYPDRPSCFLGFTKDKVNGWLESGMVLIEYASKNIAKFEVIPVSDKTEPIAVALPQNDSAWRDLINFTIQDMSSDGSFKKIYDKWFGQDTPYMFPMKRTIEVWPE